MFHRLKISLISMTGLLLFSYLQGASSRWSISEAHQEDLKEALTLDHDVTFEFFKPLYQREWKNHPLGKDPEPYLEKELFHDVHEFRKAVDNPHSRLLIARSMLHKKLVGLLLCSRHYVNRKEFCEIDLLLVSKDYRGGGVGRELMEKAFSCYPQADCWDVFPMQRGNDAAIAFYEKMGFEREGTGPGGEKNVYGIDKDQWSYHYRRKGVEKSSKS